MKRNPGGHKFKEDSEMGTAIDNMAEKKGVLAATGNRKISFHDVMNSAVLRGGGLCGKEVDPK
jgi:hypothetical protein